MKNEHFDGHWWAQALLDWQKRARPHDDKPLTDDGTLTELGRRWVRERIIDRHAHHERLETEAEKHVAEAKGEIEKAKAELALLPQDAADEAVDWAKRVHATAVAKHEDLSKTHGDAFVKRFHLEALGGPDVLHDDFCSMIEQEIAEMLLEPTVTVESDAEEQV